MQKMKKIIVVVAVLLVLGVCVWGTTRLLFAKKLRVATFNIQATSSTDVVAMNQLLVKNNVDVVGMQEVDKNNSRNNYDMLGRIVEEGNFGYSMFQMSAEALDGGYGNGILSRYEIKDSSGGLYIHNAEGDDRSWQKVELQMGDKRISVYNTHLTYISQEIRAKQLQELKDIMDKDTNKYKILVGDFNTDQSHDEITLFLKDYNIANGKDGIWYDTFNNKNNIPNSMKTYAVDNIITSKNIKVEVK